MKVKICSYINILTLLAKLSKGLMGLFMLKEATKWALAMFLWCSRPCKREIKSTVDLWMFHCKTKNRSLWLTCRKIALQ